MNRFNGTLGQVIGKLQIADILIFCLILIVKVLLN